MVKICCCVVGNTLKEFLKNLKIIQKQANFVELRADYIKNLSIDDLEIIRKNTNCDCIFTCRSVEEGGKFTGTKKELLNIIYKANKLKFNHIDVEISKLKDLKFGKNNKKYSKIIGSYHNFSKTPGEKQLMNIYNKIAKFDCVDVVKIATKVNNDEDNINLVKLLLKNQNSKNAKKLIVLGIGEKGKITRIISPLLGGYTTFASSGKKKTADGQYGIEELKKIYNQK